MMHPHTAIRRSSRSITSGAYATRDIPAGTVVWTRDTQHRRAPSRSGFGVLEDEGRRACYVNVNGSRHFLWDHTRDVTHACAPNCASGDDLSRVVALRDIKKGEPLTQDFAELVGFAPFRCSCGHDDCVSTVVPASLHHSSRWDESVRLALASATPPADASPPARRSRPVRRANAPAI